MVASLLGNWLFLAIVSSIATALLIFLSAEAFGGFHTSLIMTVRIVGVSLLVIPILIYVIVQNRTGIQHINAYPYYVLLVIAIGVCAAISWYSFYLALEVAKSQSASIATVTAINYASVALILFLSWIFGRQNPDWRNWLGVGLVVAGVFLTSLTPPTSGQPAKSTSADTLPDR